MRHELLTQRALFCIGVNAKKGYADSAFRDACRTSSGFCQLGVCLPLISSVLCWGGGGGGGGGDLHGISLELARTDTTYGSLSASFSDSSSISVPAVGLYPLQTRLLMNLPCEGGS